MSEVRLERMEGKIDKLVEAVLLMSTLHASVEKLDDRVDKMELGIQEINKRMPLLDLVLKGLGRAGYILIGLAVTAVVGSIWLLQ